MTRLLDRHEVAARLGLGATKVQELFASGALRTVRIGKLRRVSEDDLCDFITRGGTSQGNGENPASERTA